MHSKLPLGDIFYAGLLEDEMFIGLTDCLCFLVGFFAPCSHPQIPSHLQLLEESLPPDPGGSSSTSHSAVIGNRNKCPAPGTLYNTNTLESFTGMDRPSLLKSAALQVTTLIRCFARIAGWFMLLTTSKIKIVELDILLVIKLKTRVIPPLITFLVYLVAIIYM